MQIRFDNNADNFVNVAKVDLQIPELRGKYYIAYDKIFVKHEQRLIFGFSRVGILRIWGIDEEEKITEVEFNCQENVKGGEDNGSFFQSFLGYLGMSGSKKKQGAEEEKKDKGLEARKIKMGSVLNGNLTVWASEGPSSGKILFDILKLTPFDIFMLSASYDSEGKVLTKVKERRIGEVRNPIDVPRLSSRVVKRFPINSGESSLCLFVEKKPFCLKYSIGDGKERELATLPNFTRCCIVSQREVYFVSESEMRVFKVDLSLIDFEGEILPDLAKVEILPVKNASLLRRYTQIEPLAGKRGLLMHGHSWTHLAMFREGEEGKGEVVEIIKLSDSRTMVVDVRI